MNFTILVNPPSSHPLIKKSVSSKTVNVFSKFSKNSKNLLKNSNGNEAFIETEDEKNVTVTAYAFGGNYDIPCWGIFISSKGEEKARKTISKIYIVADRNEKWFSINIKYIISPVCIRFINHIIENQDEFFLGSNFSLTVIAEEFQSFLNKKYGDEGSIMMDTAR